MEVDVLGTFNFLKAVSKVHEKNPLDLVIIFSTSEIFGEYAFNVGSNAVASVGSAGESRWIYAASKIVSEHIGMSYFYEKGLPVVIVRPFNVYGPGQIGEGAIQKFIKRALNGENLEINGDGSQIRSWIYVEDFVHGIDTIIKNKEKSIGRSFNLGNPRSTTTIYELASIIRNLTKANIDIIFKEKLSSDVALRVPLIDDLKALGFDPKFEMIKGLEKTIEYYKTT